jgi:hypothetical protein
MNCLYFFFNIYIYIDSFKFINFKLKVFTLEISLEKILLKESLFEK